MTRLVLLLALLGSAEARAGGQARFGVVVGANRGEPGEVTLLYAEQDAARVAQVLTHFGGVPPEDLVLLRGVGAAEVERVLEALRQRVEEATRAGQETVALLYYSGHADAQALHLGASRLPLRRLTELLDATGAQVRLAVVDACRSGELTRLKGAVPAEPFQIAADDRLASEGTAVITSSAAGEDAQESDRLRGGVFTHHLVTGLLGAADASGDSRVTLSEAFRYAYEQTLRTTSRARFVQHPTYSFALRGRQELVLTRLTATGGLGRLELPAPGTYVLLPLSGAGSTAELSARGPTRVLVEPGRWLVRRRSAAAVWEAPAVLRAGEVTSVAAAGMTRVPYGETVRKGYAGGDGVWGVGVAAAASGPWLPDTEAGPLASLGLRLDLEPLTLEVRVRWGRVGATNELVALTQDALGADLGVAKLFDLAWGLSPGFGLRLGGEGVWQRFETAGEAPERRAVVGRASPHVRLEWAAVPWLSVLLEGGADLYLLPEGSGSEAGAPELVAAPTAGLGLTVFLP